MSAPTKISFARRPSMVPAYARVLLGKKPHSASEGTVIEPVELEARTVKLSAAHLQRYRDVCAVLASVDERAPLCFFPSC